VQFLRNLIEKQRKLYHAKDSKLHKLWPLFDAFETFLFAPDHRAAEVGRARARLRRPEARDEHGHHRDAAVSVVGDLEYRRAALCGVAQGRRPTRNTSRAGCRRCSRRTSAAPTAFDTVIFGLQRMLPILIVSYGVGLGIEMLFSVIRKEEVSEGYLVSGMLIALIVPASIPLWQLAIGVAFAVVLGKEVFGGTGMNIFNPAMLVRAFLFFAFAAQMSGDAVWVAGNQAPAGVPGSLVDGYSGRPRSRW
jgi:Na+-transporting NADH:ubiquinone oxidoreductase subunit B